MTCFMRFSRLYAYPVLSGPACFLLRPKQVPRVNFSLSGFAKIYLFNYLTYLYNSYDFFLIKFIVNNSLIVMIITAALDYL